MGLAEGLHTYALHQGHGGNYWDGNRGIFCLLGAGFGSLL